MAPLYQCMRHKIEIRLAVLFSVVKVANVTRAYSYQIPFCVVNQRLLHTGRVHTCTHDFDPAPHETCGRQTLMASRIHFGVLPDTQMWAICQHPVMSIPRYLLRKETQLNQVLLFIMY